MSTDQSSQPNVGTTMISSIAATALAWSPTAWIKSWLLYLGIQTHVRSTIDPDLKPLHNICEYLHALHVYTDEARQGVVRTVEAYHYCSHVSKDFRQCLIYASNAPTAPLIGIEYMIPRSRFLTLPLSERKLWHSHVHEVHSGMLILPYPTSHPPNNAKAKQAWDDLETQAMGEVVEWYGKIFHFWDPKMGDELPLGMPTLMGSLTEGCQLDVDGDEVMKKREEWSGTNPREKRALRAELPRPEVVEGADSWWVEARREGRGVYAAAKGKGEGEGVVE